jgi:hypothetical protein
MRVEGPALRLETGLLANPLDLCSKRGNGSLGLHSRPQCAARALLEAADACNLELEALGSNSGKRISKIVGYRPLDLSDETQGEVKLIVVLPAEIRAIIHCVDQQIADRLGWTDGNEEPVHRPQM